MNLETPYMYMYIFIFIHSLSRFIFAQNYGYGKLLSSCYYCIQLKITVERNIPSNNDKIKQIKIYPKKIDITFCYFNYLQDFYFTNGKFYKAFFIEFYSCL